MGANCRRLPNAVKSYPDDITQSIPFPHDRKQQRYKAVSYRQLIPTTIHPTMFLKSFYKDKINMTSQGNIPLGGQESKPGRATATCYCGTVQIEVATQKPDLVDTFICNCAGTSTPIFSTHSSLCSHLFTHHFSRLPQNHCQHVRLQLHHH